MAFSALLSWITPTAAFAMRMRKITAGSTKAPKGEASSSTSSKAKTNDMTADARRMRTSWSLNCSRINSQMGVPGSSGSSFVEGHGQYSEQGDTWQTRAHHLY